MYCYPYNRSKTVPSIDEHTTVSRDYETLMFKYFGYGYYWSGQDVWGEYTHPNALAQQKPPDMEDFKDITDSAEHNNHLRSINELQGYEVNARDSTFGLIYDLILDTDNWIIPLIVVDTHNLWPGGKKVLIAPKHIDSINWLAHNVNSLLCVEEIKNCPEYEPELLNDKVYQDKVSKQLALI